MTVYPRTSSPPQLRFADIAFLAGNPHHPTPPVIEHVVLIAAPATPVTREDWHKVKFYGLPESSSGPNKTHSLQFRMTGSCWGDRSSSDPASLHVTSSLGHPVSVWNLIMRMDEIDVHAAEFLSQRAAEAVGGMYYCLAKHFHVEEKDGVRHTSCLGFVVDFLTRPLDVIGVTATRISPLVAKFDEVYTVPFRVPEDRDWPAIGHLAQALVRKDLSQPFGLGIKRAEAEATALAKFFLQGLSPPPP